MLKNLISTVLAKTISGTAMVLPLVLLNNFCFAQQTVTIPLDDFTKISLKSTSRVKIIPGTSNSVTFKGSESDKEKVTDLVEDGEFTIKGHLLSNAEVTVKQLEQIEIQGTASVVVSGPVTADHFIIEISGAGDLDLVLQAKTVEVDISGAGNLKLSGYADKLDLDISGAGNVEAGEFKTKVCNADISGNGNCTVDVTDELNSSIRGSGSVNYKNEPAKITTDQDRNDFIKNSEAEGNGDTTRFKLGRKNVLIVNEKESEKKLKKDKIEPHWAGIELGFNGYLSPENKMTVPGYDFLELNQFKSVAVNLNFFDYEIKLYKRYIMLVSGLGLSYNNYRFKSDSVLVSGGSGIYAVKTDSLNYKKNKLTVTYLTLPVLLEFNTSKYTKRSFHVSAGAIFGYLLSAHTKQVYTVDGEKQKNKSYDEFSINPWRIDATARIGYRNFNLFANYDLISLFRTDKGPELFPYTIGLTVAGW